MLDALTFVKGAVARRDYSPVLTHFRISAGKVMGYNGAIALCSPIDLDLECSPKATSFVRAVETCTETVKMHLTPGGKLSIKSGAFTAFVECSPEEFPTIEHSGRVIPLHESFLTDLETLAPFMAEDASRPWACGILFRGASAFATNNIVLVEKWLGCPIDCEAAIPKSAVLELLRIGKPPVSMQLSEKSVTFHFAEDQWLFASLAAGTWPDLSKILDKPSNATPVPPLLFDELEKLVHFANDEQDCYLLKNAISTGRELGDGASVELEGLAIEARFNLKQLLLLKGVATSIDFSLYPLPCIFFGEKLRGAIVGMVF